MKDRCQISGRIYDTWKPLLDIARAVGDEEWLQHAHRVMEKETRLQGLSQAMEDTQALVHALGVLSEKQMNGHRFNLREVKKTLRDEFDVNMNAQQIMDTCQQLGIPVVRPHGYPQVKLDKKLIQALEEQMSRSEEVEGEKMGENPLILYISTLT